MAIRDFFVKLTNEEISSKCNLDILDPEIIKCVKISQTQEVTAIQVSLNCNVIE
ncbi:4393_t:CDS:1, partial [Gigaspora margarita]